MEQLIRRMCKEDTFGLSRLGEPEDVAAITPQALFAHYQNILRTSRIDVFYVGAAPVNQVAQLIREMLESLPDTAEDEEKKSRETGRKNLEKILGKISTCMWLCTVIVYILISFTSGAWNYTWLIFLWSSIGQILLDMVKKVNRGKPLKKVLKGDGSAIFWLIVTTVYFFISFASGAWHLTWLVFLAGAALQTFAGMFFD